MPEDKGLFSMPFILRRMFPWGDSAKIQIEVDYTANETGPFFLIGQTREGIFKFRIDPDGDGTSGNDVFQITDFPLWVTVSCDSLSVNPRGFYGSVYLVVNGERVSKLVTGYVSPSKTLTWPAINEESQVPNRGWFTLETSANPAAGAEVSLTVPTGELWLIHAIKLSLATDATVATRKAHFVFEFDAESNMRRVICSSALTASATWVLNCITTGSVSDSTENQNCVFTLPDNCWLRQGDKFTTETDNLQAGDNYTAAALLVEKYLDQY